MKKLISLALIVFVLCGALCSCNDVQDEKIITDIKAYESIWDLSERRIGDYSDLFPKKVENKQVIKFNCIHSTYSFIGTGWQVELEIKYDDNSFSTEENRLKNVCKDSVICGNSNYFDCPNFASVWNWNSCYEYAVVNETDNTIGYIYLQLIDKEDLKISKKYVPNQYEMELQNSKSYTIYS